MRNCLWLVVLSGCLVVSCEKLRQATGKLGGGNDEEVTDSGAVAQPGGEISDEYKGLVDFTDKGYRFRRDLPFPGKVMVREEDSLEISNGRLFGRSALGSGSTPVEGSVERVTLFERDGSRVTVRVESDRFVKPIIEGEGEAAGQTEEGESKLGESLEGLDASFLRVDNGWRQVGEKSDFRVMAWATQLQKVLDEYLKGTGVVPNSQWFGSNRMLPGVGIELRGDQTALILGSAAKGKIGLQFDRVENIEGHPCGVFRWTGEFNIVDSPTLAGERENVEMSVSAGQMWCSLIYPVVLREESEGVMTIERRARDGNLTMRLQGAVKERRSLRWQPQGG